MGFVRLGLSVFFVLVFAASFWWAVWEAFGFVFRLFGVWE
jgi:hypothetical protein